MKNRAFILLLLSSTVIFSTYVFASDESDIEKFSNDYSYCLFDEVDKI